MGEPVYARLGLPDARPACGCYELPQPTPDARFCAEQSRRALRADLRRARGPRPPEPPLRWAAAMDEPRRALREIFGFDDFRPGQAEAVARRARGPRRARRHADRRRASRSATSCRRCCARTSRSSSRRSSR